MCAGPPDRHALFVTVLAATAVLVAMGCGDGTEATTQPPRTATTRAARARPVTWTHTALLRRLVGRRIRVAGRAVRIDADTVVCHGVGPASARKGGEPAWTRFHCLQPTFPDGAVAGPDAVFTVEPAGRSAFVVTGGRFTAY